MEDLSKWVETGKNTKDGEYVSIARDAALVSQRT